MSSQNYKFLKVFFDDPTLWYKRACHANMKTLDKFAKQELVTRFPKLNYTRDQIFQKC